MEKFIQTNAAKTQTPVDISTETAPIRKALSSAVKKSRPERFSDKMLEFYGEGIPNKILLDRRGLALKGFWKALTIGIDPEKHSKLTHDPFSK